MTSTQDILTSSVMTFARGAVGHRAVAHGHSPVEALVLYEYEACPYCRRVREALSALDLNAIIVPCPRGSTNREAVMAQGGKAQFPFLVDSKAKVALYESEDICNYLSKTYADGAKPWQHKVSTPTGLGGTLAQAMRPSRGIEGRAKKTPEKLLHLWSYEASPYSRLVREVLCELELSYMLHNVARQSAQRDDFVAMSGKMQVPYLKDPNTGTALFESKDIIAYLERTYG